MTARGLSRELEALAEWLRESFATDAVRLSTWTFRTPPWGAVGEQYASKAGSLLSERLSRGGVSAFLARERGTLEGRQHWHALSTDHASLDLARRWWNDKYGFTKVSDVVDSSTAASLYVSKYVVKSDLQFYAVGPRFATEFSFASP